MAPAKPRLIVSLAGASLAIIVASLAIAWIVPRYHLGGDSAGDAMLAGMIVLPMWLASLGLSIVTFVLSVRAWKHLANATRLFGIFPAVAYVVAIGVDLLLWRLD